MYFSFILEDSKMRKGGLTLEGYSEDTVRLVGYGREDCSDLHSWGPGVRAFYIIHYVIRGAGFLECGGKRFRITAGESFLLYPYTELFYYPDPEDPWEYTWVDFTGKEIGRLLSRTGFSFSWPVAPVIGAEDILPLFDRLGRLDFLSRGKGEANGLLLAILGVYGDIFPAPQVPARKEDDRLSTALLLIQGNYHKADFNVERLCTAMHVNRVTLYRLFSGKLGVSPNGYISHYRLEQGKKLLEMGFSVKNTALSCGFSDPFYFSRAFKAYTGMAPAAYKAGPPQIS